MFYKRSVDAIEFRSMFLQFYSHNSVLIINCLSDDCLEYGEFKYRCHTYPAHNCARAGKIGKARIRTLKMTLVIGKSCVNGTNSDVVR